MKFLFYKPKCSSLSADIMGGLFFAATFYGILYIAIFGVKP